MKSRTYCKSAVIVLGLTLAACTHTGRRCPRRHAIPTLIPATMPAPGRTEHARRAWCCRRAAPVAANGAAIYAENCADCHGPDARAWSKFARFRLDYLRAAAPGTLRVVPNGAGDMRPSR